MHSVSTGSQVFAKASASAVLLLLCTAIQGCKGDPASGPSGIARPKADREREVTLVADRVTLAPEEYLGFGFHPTTNAATISTTSTHPLRVCPADSTARLAKPGSSSWGRRWPGPTCKSLVSGSPVRLPATDGQSHVSIAVGGLAEAVTFSEVLVAFYAADGFSLFRPARGTPGARSPRFGIGNATSGEFSATITAEHGKVALGA